VRQQPTPTATKAISIACKTTLESPSQSNAATATLAWARAAQQLADQIGAADFPIACQQVKRCLDAQS
jgi:hypothetical protein